MKRWLLWAALLGLALAAPLPQVYDRLETTLARVRLDNPTGALAALDQAQGLLRQEAEGLPPVLRDAAISNLQEARQAVLRKSPVDLEARLFLVRHLLGKALYDGFFTAQGEEKALYLSRLVRATGLGQGAVREVAGLPPEEARRRLEGRYLALMAQDLAQALAATSRPQAYLALARAYARYLVIQDSQRSTLKAQDFIQALAKVSGGEAFRPEVGEIQKKVLAWREALRPGAAAPVPSPQAGTPAPAPSSPLPVQESPRVETFYVASWADPALRERLRRVAYDLGFAYYQDFLEVLTQTQLQLGLATAALGQGNQGEARAHLEAAFWNFSAKIEPLAALVNPSLTERTLRALTRLTQAVGVRAIDVFPVYEALEELGRQFRTGPRETPWLDFRLSLLNLVGIPRAVFFLLAAALAFFPLYLIRLTFGGRNVYWNLLGLAFLFLLLPILAEGLSYFASVMAEYGGLPWLAALANLSIGQGLLPYLAWGLSAFLVVALAGAGLRGIAAQFGLLKERGAEVMATGVEPPPSTLTSETIVEWDEEF
ncbi:MAG: hypothetical protein ACO2OU_10820 [Thermus aquaticus]|uniref:hypothetical protein n=1 Tax=Thermus aquaticus TaxID=271 RepID=UPI003C115F2D